MNQTIWLLGLRPGTSQGRGFKLWLLRRFWRFWPQLLTQKVGRLPNWTDPDAGGHQVQLLELPYTKGEFRALPPFKRRQLLQQGLDWLQQPQNQTLRIGLPLSLQTLLPKNSRPGNLAPGWQLAAQEFVRQTAAQTGGLKNRQAALIGVENACPAEPYICSALLAAGCQPVLYGSHALSLAEHFFQRYGVAIPVFGARKAIRSSQIIIILNRRPPAGFSAGETGPKGKAVFYFKEPHITVSGSFGGRFSFGSFPAGQAAALLPEPAKISLDK